MIQVVINFLPLSLNAVEAGEFLGSASQLWRRCEPRSGSCQSCRATSSSCSTAPPWKPATPAFALANTPERESSNHARQHAPDRLTLVGGFAFSAVLQIS